MAVTAPDSYTKSKFIRVNKKVTFKIFAEKLLLGRWDVLGYGNGLSGTMRMFAAGIQTIFGFAILLGVYFVLDSRGFFGPKPQSGPDVGSAFATNVATTTSVLILLFTGSFIHERANLYSKWRYLADLFNSIITLQNASLKHRDHILACHACDTLTLDMWAHESFRESFKLALRDAVRDKYKNDDLNYFNKLAEVARIGIGYEEALKLLGEHSGNTSDYINDYVHTSSAQKSPGQVVPAFRMNSYQSRLKRYQK